MVITRPMPSMPIFFWNDTDGSRYRDSYFATWPGVWDHGDWISETSRGTFIIHGRSDATLNRGGVRLGTAEIYAAVETIPSITGSLVVGVVLPDGDYHMPLFVVLGEGVVLDDDLRVAVRDAIRAHASARHVPDEIIVVPAIPVSHANKRLEVPVKRLLSGRLALDGVNRAVFANPGSIDWFADYAATMRSRA
jgi:acetoacetyl-CoA synthetase